MKKKISDNHWALLHVRRSFKAFLRSGNLHALDRAYLEAHYAPREIREAIRPLLICPPIARAVTARAVAEKIERAIEAELGQ